MNSDMDSDIKIYVKKSDAEKAELDESVQNSDFGTDACSAEKAESLGKAFALLKPTDSVLGIFGADDSPTSAILYQARVLITFLCDRMAKEKISSAGISDTVRNSMYDTLKENARGYYDNIADGIAFSFYRLAYKKTGDRRENIAAEFSKLCSSPKDASIFELGKRVFDAAVGYACSLIDECDFNN